MFTPLFSRRCPPTSDSFPLRITRIRYDVIQAACIAVDANKAPRKDTTFDERSEFAFDESRYIPVMFALPDKERFQMSRNHSIQGIFFGIARTVDLFELHEDIAERKTPAHSCG
jgi:hypothetical protein